MENNKEDMIKKIEEFSNYSWDDHKKRIMERNKIIRKIFNLIKLPCKGCKSCCCMSCGNDVGFFCNSDEGHYFKEELKKVLKKKGADNWHGFWNKEKGCMLPIEIRSPTCIYHICSNLPDKYLWIKKIFNICRNRSYNIPFNYINEILRDVYNTLLIQENVVTSVSMGTLISVFKLGENSHNEGKGRLFHNGCKKKIITYLEKLK